MGEELTKSESMLVIEIGKVQKHIKVTSLGHVSLPLSLVIYLRINPPAEFLQQRAWTLVHVVNSLRVGQLSIKCPKHSAVDMWSNPLTFPSRFRA